MEKNNIKVYEIRIKVYISPYFTLSHKLKKALKNAVKRGVKVEIMLSDRKSTRLNSSHVKRSRMPSSA